MDRCYWQLLTQLLLDWLVWNMWGFSRTDIMCLWDWLLLIFLTGADISDSCWYFWQLLIFLAVADISDSFWYFWRLQTQLLTDWLVWIMWGRSRTLSTDVTDRPRGLHFHCTIPYCIVHYSAALYNTVLYCTVLYCTAFELHIRANFYST